MCDFYSGIITKDGKVLDTYKDSHTAIKEKYNLNDNVDNIDKLDFFPFEILPKSSVFDKPIKKNWDLKISASNYPISKDNLPKWLNKSFLKKYEKKMWKSFKTQWKERVFQDCEIKELNEPKYYYLKNVKIEYLRNKVIVEAIYGNSIIKSMNDNSIVRFMEDNSIVKLMYKNSIVKFMYNYSIVESMNDNSIVKFMWENSIVKSMWYNSIIESMNDNSIVETMKDNSIVEYMNGNSIVKFMNGLFVCVTKFNNTKTEHIKGTLRLFRDDKLEVIHKN